jgi:hypothetical protein
METIHKLKTADELKKNWQTMAQPGPVTERGYSTIPEPESGANIPATDMVSAPTPSNVFKQFAPFGPEAASQAEMYARMNRQRLMHQ